MKVETVVESESHDDLPRGENCTRTKGMARAGKLRLFLSSRAFYSDLGGLVEQILVMACDAQVRVLTEF